MALTRKFCKGLGLTDEQIESIIEAHTEVTDGQKKRIEELEKQAGQLESVQKELDTLKGQKTYKEEYDKAVKDLADYKAEIAGKEKAAKIQAAYKDLLAEKNVGDKYITSVLGVTDFSGMELGEDGKLKNADELSKAIESKWAGFITTTRTKGAGVDNPPKDNTGGSGANSRAAELARQYHERRYGKAAEPANNNNE